jgi:protein involved in polysaccharide export with SLBB domain
VSRGTRIIGWRAATLVIDWFTARAERAAVEAEVREEFDGHLRRIEEELVSQGMPLAEARGVSRARFGDTERLVRDATRIKIGDTLMLQRINLVLLVIVGAAVVWLLVQNQRISSRSVQTLERVSASLSALQSRQSAESPAGPRTKTVYVEGLVERPGTYQIPPGGMGLRRAIADAGGLKSGALTVYLSHEGSADDLVFSPSNVERGTDLALKPGDVITATDQPDKRAPKEIQVEVRGYVQSPGKFWRPEEGATLAAVLQQPNNQLEPGANSVKLERSTPAPWSVTLTGAEALAEAGREVKVQSGDVISVLNPEADAAAPAEWKRYERSERVRELARSDRDLMWLVEQRESRDREYDSLVESGYARGHRKVSQLRDAAAEMERFITRRVRELLQPEIDRAAAGDDTLRELEAKRVRLEDEVKALSSNPGKVGELPRDSTAKRQEYLAANAEVLARYDELTKNKPH